MVKVIRTENSSDGVFGQMTIGTITLCTMEDDWKNNQPGESCIPAGTYKLRRSVYHKGGYACFEICNVPNRQRILIHRGNTEEDVKGCIAVGTRFGMLNVGDEDDENKTMTGKKAVVESKIAFGKFMAALEGVDETEIVIEWAVGLP